jgi:hypothetical protein
VSSANSGWHLPPEVIARYSDPAGQPAASWLASVEAHLAGCAACRAQLTVPPADARVLHEIGARLAHQAPRIVQYRRPRRAWSRMFAGLPVAWVLASIAVGLLAAGADLAGTPRLAADPSVLLLLAPILPLIGVGAAWAPSLDPIHELTASTPSAGLPTLLRRTVLTVLPIVAVSAVIGLLTDAAPPGLWLLPCLALTTGALALGSVIPLPAAATAVVGAWSVLVLGPGLIDDRSTALLGAAAWPGWLAAVALTAAWVLLRRRAYYQS